MGEAATAEREEIGAIETRPGTQADHAFLFATLLRNVKSSAPEFRRVSNTVFFAAHHLVVERILARGGSLVIAHPAGDPQTILGYLLYERMEPGTNVAGVAVPEVVVHYVYTKANFRRFGVARALFASQRIVPGAIAFTHRTPDADALWRKFPTAEYWGPYLA